MANPMQVRGFFARAREELPGVELTAHFHNTRGQGLANVLAALESGVDSFESSFGELGGCPVPAGATGNIATEDLVSMLHEMGVETGIDLERLLGCARRAQEVLGRPLQRPSADGRPGRLAPGLIACRFAADLWQCGGPHPTRDPAGRAAARAHRGRARVLHRAGGALGAARRSGSTLGGRRAGGRAERPGRAAPIWRGTTSTASSPVGSTTASTRVSFFDGRRIVWRRR